MSNVDEKDSLAGGPVLGSILTIIIVTIVVTTTITAYTAAPLATSTTSSFSRTNTFSRTHTQAALTWTNSSDYPTEIWTQSCVTSGTDVYCVGGIAGNSTADITDAVYYSSISPTAGLSAWSNTTAYPMDIRSESCVASAETIYCVGGYNNTEITENSYYASLSSSGVGQWQQTTSYPFPVWTQSCAVADAIVYCVGGETVNSNETDLVFYAPITATGLGNWTRGNSYPVIDRQQSCAATVGDIYCVGGLDQTDVFYAPIGTSGMGAWSNTTTYPFTVGANLLSCTTVNGRIYCVGGHTGPNVSDAVYFATVSSTGVSSWTAETDYPTGVWGLSCDSVTSQIFCIGGSTQSGATVSEVSSSPLL